MKYLKLEYMKHHSPPLQGSHLQKDNVNGLKYTYVKLSARQDLKSTINITIIYLNYIPEKIS